MLVAIVAQQFGSSDSPFGGPGKEKRKHVIPDLPTATLVVED